MDKAWKLMEPIQVGSYTFKNRIVMPPMESRLSTVDGDVTQEMCDYYAERAKGGVGAIVVENTFVDSIAARSSLRSSGISLDHHVAGKYRLAEAIKQNGSVAIIQLSHGGLQAKITAVPGQDCLAPSAVASQFVKRMPRPLTVEEIVGIEDAFAAAAVRARDAGFDGVEIHGAHGYLICSFFSPYTNKRTDEYGGSRENRCRFAMNIIKKVRERVGYDFIVGLRISGAEYVDGGLTIEDTTAYGKMLEDYIDYIHVSVANYERMARWLIPPLYRPMGLIVDLASAMKKAVTKCKVITVNSLSVDIAEKALQNGDADMAAFGRALIADPYLPNKIKENRIEDIRPCMRGHEGCVSLFFTGAPMRCEVNAEVGREREYKIHKVEKPKKVVIVGGGMAGMEAARVANLYGHEVVLIEKSDHLGGHFVEACKPKFKEEALGVLNWLKRQVEKSGVQVKMNTEATPDLIKSLKPDSLILAVGSDYIRPSIPGIERTITAEKALMDTDSVKSPVAIIGGGLVGSETGLYLAQNGHDVTILEMRPDIVPEDEPLSQIALKEALEEANVKVLTNAKVVEIGDGSVTCEREGKRETANVATAVAALGLAARRDVVEKLQGVCDETLVIGDAVRGRKLYNCTNEAWVAVRKISGVEFL